VKRGELVTNIVYEILPDGSADRCDRCKSIKYPRIGLIISPTLHETGEIIFPMGEPYQSVEDRRIRIVMCAMCLANAIQSVTGWDMQSLVLRYATVSPRFESTSSQSVSNMTQTKRRKSTNTDIRQKPKSPIKRR
jgi:hypothetical protein